MRRDWGIGQPAVEHEEAERKAAGPPVSGTHPSPVPTPGSLSGGAQTVCPGVSTPPAPSPRPPARPCQPSHGDGVGVQESPPPDGRLCPQLVGSRGGLSQPWPAQRLCSLMHTLSLQHGASAWRGGPYLLRGRERERFSGLETFCLLFCS